MPKKSRKNLNLVLVGARGKMGQEIQSLCQGKSGFRVVGVVNQAADWQGLIEESVDLVVDFSQPGGLRTALKWCEKNRKPLVSGTTGLSSADRSQIRKSAKKIPILYSANMSMGVAVMTSMLKSFGAIKEWKFQIEEAHHAQKKDRPSGTALLLQDQLSQVLGRSLPKPISIREGDTPGIHEIWATGPDEVLVLQHTASNRRIFARGALRAARWLFDKKRPGLYDLSDLYTVP